MLRSAFAWAASAWHKLQVGHRGLYSVERLYLLLNEYQAKTSVGRALLVCLGSLVPTLVVLIVVEAMPLASPLAGWKKNWTTWIRLWVSVAI